MPETDFYQMSDYEREREKRIARNNAYLEELGLGNSAKSMREATKARKKKR